MAGSGAGDPAGIVLRPVSAEEITPYFHTLYHAFNGVPRDDELEMELTVFEPQRSLAAFDGKDLVGTAAAYTRTMTVPGAELPIAAVTMVSVASTHRRRRLLTAMMRRQLTELHEQRREPVAALWASEGVIYQRFGYGLAAVGAKLNARTRSLVLRPETDTGAGRVRLVGEEEALPQLVEVYEVVRRHTPGFLDRAGLWWDHRLYDPEHQRGGATANRYALLEEPSGQVTGYAVYRVRSKTDDEDDWAGEVSIRELLAADPRAYAALWAFLIGLDLVRGVERHNGPADEPLTHLVTDPRAVKLRLVDQLWVRLADVGRALTARAYIRELDVVLDVADPFCPWNARRWRLSGGPGGAICEPTTDPADLSLTSTELGAAYLGGTRLATLAAAGRVRELRPGALHAATTAFAGDRPPWCPEVF